MLNGQKSTTLLKTSNGIVRLCEDTVVNTYSIGLRTEGDMQFKYISKELHDLLVQELSTQEGLK